MPAGDRPAVVLGVALSAEEFAQGKSAILQQMAQMRSQIASINVDIANESVRAVRLTTDAARTNSQERIRIYRAEQAEIRASISETQIQLQQLNSLKPKNTTFSDLNESLKKVQETGQLLRDSLDVALGPLNGIASRLSAILALGRTVQSLFSSVGEEVAKTSRNVAPIASVARPAIAAAGAVATSLIRPEDLTVQKALAAATREQSVNDLAAAEALKIKAQQSTSAAAAAARHAKAVEEDNTATIQQVTAARAAAEAASKQASEDSKATRAAYEKAAASKASAQELTKSVATAEKAVATEASVKINQQEAKAAEELAVAERAAAETKAQHLKATIALTGADSAETKVAAEEAAAQNLVAESYERSAAAKRLKAGPAVDAGVSNATAGIQVEAAASEAATAATGTFLTVLGAVAGTATVVALTLGALVLALGEIGKSAAEDELALQVMASRMGVTTKEVQEFQLVAKTAGTSADELARALAQFSHRAIGGGEVIDPEKMAQSQKLLKELGIQVRETSKEVGGNLVTSFRSSKDILLDLSDVFEKLPNGIAKNQLAYQLFGRQGLDLIPILSKGRDGIQELADAADKYSVDVNEKHIDALHRYESATFQLGQEWTKFKQSIADTGAFSALITMLNGVVSALNSALNAVTGYSSETAHMGDATAKVVDQITQVRVAESLLQKQLDTPGQSADFYEDKRKKLQKLQEEEVKLRQTNEVTAAGFGKLTEHGQERLDKKREDLIGQANIQGGSTAEQDKFRIEGEKTFIAELVEEQRARDALLEKQQLQVAANKNLTLEQKANHLAVLQAQHDNLSVFSDIGAGVPGAEEADRINSILNQPKTKPGANEAAQETQNRLHREYVELISKESDKEKDLTIVIAGHQGKVDVLNASFLAYTRLVSSLVPETVAHTLAVKRQEDTFAALRTEIGLVISAQRQLAESQKTQEAAFVRIQGLQERLGQTLEIAGRAQQTAGEKAAEARKDFDTQSQSLIQLKSQYDALHNSATQTTETRRQEAELAKQLEQKYPEVAAAIRTLVEADKAWNTETAKQKKLADDVTTAIDDYNSKLRQSAIATSTLGPGEKFNDLKNQLAAQVAELVKYKAALNQAEDEVLQLAKDHVLTQEAVSNFKKALTDAESAQAHVNELNKQLKDSTLDASKAFDIFARAISEFGTGMPRQLSQAVALLKILKELSQYTKLGSQDSKTTNASKDASKLDQVGSIISDSNSPVAAASNQAAQATRDNTTAMETLKAAIEQNTTAVQSKEATPGQVAAPATEGEGGTGLAGSVAKGASEAASGTADAAKSAQGGILSTIGNVAKNVVKNIPIIGAVVGAVGAIVGIFTAKANAQAEKIANTIKNTVKVVVQDVAEGAITIKAGLEQLQNQTQNAISQLGNSKAGKKQLPGVLDAINQEVVQLQQKAKQTILDFEKQFQVSQLPQGVQDVASQIQDLNSQIKSYIDAGGDAATATQYLNTQLNTIKVTIGSDLLNAEKDTINQMKQEIDLQRQRVQATSDANNQIAQILNQGVDSRSNSVAQSKAEQIRQVRITEQQNLLQLDQQKAELDAQIGDKAQIFGLTANQAQLEAQLLAITQQLGQADQQRLVALQQMQQFLPQQVGPGQTQVNLPAPGGGTATNLATLGDQALPQSVTQGFLQTIQQGLGQWGKQILTQLFGSVPQSLTTNQMQQIINELLIGGGSTDANQQNQAKQLVPQLSQALQNALAQQVASLSKTLGASGSNLLPVVGPGNVPGYVPPNIPGLTTTPAPGVLTPTPQPGATTSPNLNVAAVTLAPSAPITASTINLTGNTVNLSGSASSAAATSTSTAKSDLVKSVGDLAAAFRNYVAKAPFNPAATVQNASGSRTVNFQFGDIQITVPPEAGANPAATADSVRRGLSQAVMDIQSRMPSEFVV